MLATVAGQIPVGPEWVHEVKWDGMRVLADVRDGTLRLTSRAENDVTVSFPELEGLGAAYEDVLLDGEVVALDGGRPSFGALAERMHVKDRRKAERLAATRPVTLMVFDLLRLFGADLTTQPWTARRELLERLDLGGRHWQVPPVYDDGHELWDATRDNGLEGIVSKRRTSLYAASRRSADWRKSSHRTTLSAVVGGWRPETGTTDRLGAVLVGLPAAGGGWRYAGRMGSGLTGRSARNLQEALAPLHRGDSPFVDEVPSIDANGTTWVEPQVVVELKTLGSAEQSRLRHPAFLGIRHDLRPADLLEAQDADA
jgi:bifunctional non-homologous end joining protein LigD